MKDDGHHRFPLAALEVPLDAIVSHELGHAVCAAELGLSVIDILLPTIITKADDGSGYYARKAQTQIDNMYLEDAPGINKRLNPAILGELAAVSVAGAVAELVLQGQQVNSANVCTHLRIQRNLKDRALLVEALGADLLIEEQARPHIERAERVLAARMEGIRAAVPTIVAAIIDSTPDSLAWAEIESYLQF
jgi:hypothetical protein